MPISESMLVRQPQLLARIDAAVLAAQPLAVDRCVRASDTRTRVRPSRSIASR